MRNLISARNFGPLVNFCFRFGRLSAMPGPSYNRLIRRLNRGKSEIIRDGLIKNDAEIVTEDGATNRFGERTRARGRTFVGERGLKRWRAAASIRSATIFHSRTHPPGRIHRVDDHNCVDDHHCVLVTCYPCNSSLITKAERSLARRHLTARRRPSAQCRRQEPGSFTRSC
jgi:hypothetical protein